MTFGDGSKRTIIAGAFSVALGLVALTGCGASTSSGGYTLTDGKVEFEGKTLTVTLDCDGSYEWEESATGDGLTYDGVQHDEEQNADVFTFTGIGEGEQELTFTFPSPDEKKVTVETKTDSDGQITATSATGSDGSSGSTTN